MLLDKDGSPMLNPVGIVDAGRISCDTGHSFEASRNAAPGIAALILCACGVVVGFGLLNVCEPLLATSVLHGSGSDYALLVACYGVGMVAASALVARRPGAPPSVLIRRYLDAQILTCLLYTSRCV